MTDRELLQAAAKVAGLEHVTPSMIEWGQWNPLTDDGDALRLAVKLHIYVQPTGVHAWAARFDCHATEMIGDDPCAATRRAIVRAAAAMVTPDAA